jgi:hypothetical protein
MILARDAHIDAFALNMAWGEVATVEQELQLQYAFEAASNVPGFSLFFSFDYAGNGPWAAQNVSDLISVFSDLDQYYKYNGQPFVSTFEGSDNWQDWVSIKQETGCFFMPDWSSIGAGPALAKGVADGLFSWAAWPWGGRNMDTYTDASYLNDFPSDGSILYMMAVSPWFYTNLPGYGKNWIWNGDSLWHDRWQQVNFIQPDFVEIITWNDYGESHYIGPLHEEEYSLFDIGRAPFNYANNMPHDDWRLLLPYYIDTYKNLYSEVNDESLVMWYRINSKNPTDSCTTGATSGNTATQLQYEFSPSDIVEDAIFFSAILSGYKSLTVTVGGDTLYSEWIYVPDEGVGAYHGKAIWTGQLNEEIVIEVETQFNTLRATGIPITDDCSAQGNTINWNAYVSGIVGDQQAGQLPAGGIDVMICSKGTAPTESGFQELCEFTCSLGYCPVSACVCQAMAMPLAGSDKAKRYLISPTDGTEPVPSATQADSSGYPIAGGNPSYLGLCSFACGHGWCPEEWCTTTPQIYSTPTVSPFNPDVCISGTGPGNFGGLCGFACNFGFCPAGICTCTAVGVLNPVGAPDPTIIGYYSDGSIALRILENF